MCEFCIQHGEGKKWYENMNNYSREVFFQVNSEKKFKKYLRGFKKRLSFFPYTAYWFKKRIPSFYDYYVYPAVTSNLKKNHFGQIIPLEDTETILNRVNSIVRLPCICRKVTTGKELRYCLGVGMDMTEYVKDIPDFSSFDVISKEEAKKFVRSLEEKGMVHSIWTFGTPFIGAICNCDMNCMAYNVQVKMDIARAMWKGEYVACIDSMICNGCKLCFKYCLFSAMEFDLSNRKCKINTYNCYGCGICRTLCEKGAITLKDRLEVLGSDPVW